MHPRVRSVIHEVGSCSHLGHFFPLRQLGAVITLTADVEGLLI